MKAFLINPQHHTVTQVDYDGELESLYDLLDCQRVDALELNSERDTLWVDDEGLFVDNPSTFAMQGQAGNTPIIAGKALITGCDRDGDTCEPSLALADYKRSIYYHAGAGIYARIKTSEA